MECLYLLEIFFDLSLLCCIFMPCSLSFFKYFFTKHASDFFVVANQIIDMQYIDK